VSAPGTAGARCPRCGAAFHCGIDDAEPCACAALVLDAAAQQRLHERYTGCLCVSCLRELGGRCAEGSGPALPPSRA